MNVDEIAKKLVIVSSHAGTRLLTLPTNPGWRPARVDCSRGIDRDSTQLEQAERAIVRRCLALFVQRDPLPAWIARNAARLGGMGPLTAALLGVGYRRKGITAVPGYRALLRSLQRAAPEHKAGRKQSHASIKNADYRRRIADLEGGERGNPFASDSVVAMGALRDANVALLVQGDWQISKEKKRCKRVSTNFVSDDDSATDSDLAADIRFVLSNDGSGFVEVVRDSLSRNTATEVILLHVHALQIEVKPR